MRLPLSWLAEWIDLPGDRALADRLAMDGGFEDVVVEATGPDRAAIVVGKVEACERHPNADRLSVCRVDVGDGALRTIVCGAANVAAGQKVAVALPGTELPGGGKIKKSKLRGVKSEGMICSRRELALGDEPKEAGIWVLDAGARVGAPLPEAAAVGERVLELGITPNRGDTASLLGVAREVRALFGGALRLPPTDVAESGPRAADAISISIAAGDACFHYVGRVVRGVRVGPSPPALRARLEAAGFRPINNVVDATNAVMLELGQPLHAFDLAKIGGGEIRVRRANQGESIATLDGEVRKLDSADLVIADAERAVAIAGVMGGADSEVGEATRDILIESAHFHPTAIRLAARRHGLHSEASYRFERGVDRAGIERAADRAARFIAELAGGSAAPGAVEARGDAAPAPPRIRLQVERTNRLLGLSLAPAEVAALLERVGISARPAGEGVLECEVPSHRNDIAVHQDLSEEVARMFGYENIPTTLPVAQLAPARIPDRHRIADRARDLLAGAGLVEVMTFPFVSEADIAALRLAEDDPRRLALRLRNPIQDAERALRTTLVPSLLRLVRQNLSRQVPSVGLFEVASVFCPDPAAPPGPGAESLPREPLWACAVITQQQDDLWAGRDRAPAFFRAKGIAEKALSGLGYVASLRRGATAPYLHPGASLSLWVGDQGVGRVGEVHPSVSADFGIEPASAMFELNLSALLAVKKGEFQFREVSREPSVRRDLAVLVERAQAAGALSEEIRKVAGPDLVFDRYEGRGIPEGRVSLAFRLVFQRSDRTLTDAEVNRVMDRIVAALASRFKAELR
ncbi:MAG: phenylalanine--tRNA ligase subunit beta [Deltaproteobacteria bacterium]|nr:MAG: phenylalanine--tRNA ligase subunit beta [Deltaproteobacteria bacterium]